MSLSPRYRLGVDVGGTFTDILLQLPSGELAYRKVLSSPPAYDVAVVDGVAELLGDGALVLINDDDFGISGGRTQIAVVRGTDIKRK